ncbi:MAG: hypothetical protein Q7S52_05570 [bacterium]|nr:hypothetical protein [bacterium]
MKIKRRWPAPPVDIGHHISQQKASAEEKNALIASWFHVGEEVRVNFRMQGSNLATVLGFGERYVGRGGFTHKLAGVYIDYLSVHIVSKNGGYREFVSPGQLEGPHVPYVTGYESSVLLGKMRDLNIRIGDLPDTPFWVGDLVDVRAAPRELSPYRVVEVNYGVSPPIYGLESTQPDKNRCNTEEAGVAFLVKHGNIWNLEHGKPLSFQGETEEKRLLAEAAFYKSLGMSVRFQRSKRTGVNEWSNETGQDDRWSMGTGIGMLQKGTADQIKVVDEKDLLVVIIKYDNVEFGNRMRAAELKRLGFEPEVVFHGSGIKKI